MSRDYSNLSKCMDLHTGTCTHEHSDYTKLYLHSLKQAAKGDLSELRWMKTATGNRKHGRSTFLEKEMFLGYI